MSIRIRGFYLTSPQVWHDLSVSDWRSSLAPQAGHWLEPAKKNTPNPGSGADEGRHAPQFHRQDAGVSVSTTTGAGAASISHQFHPQSHLAGDVPGAFMSHNKGAEPERSRKEE